MLNKLRKRGFAKKVLWVVAVLIILSFGLMGQAYLLRNRRGPTYAGEVFGRKVSLDEFSRQYKQAALQARIRFGDETSQKPIDMIALTWDRILLLEEARRRRIRIPDEDVVRFIEAYPFFQRDGRFDRRVYSNVLRYVFRIPEHVFEEGIRDHLKILALYEQTTQTARVDPKEVREAYRLRNETVRVDYVLFPWESHRPSTPPPIETLQRFYEDHPEDFIRPLAVKTAFVTARFPKTKEDEEVPEEVRQAVWDRILAVRQDVEKGTDLATAAAAQDLKVEEIDSLGMKEAPRRTGWPLAVIKEVFDLPAGGLAGPIETEEGYLLVRVTDRRENYLPPFTRVKDEVAAAWRKQRALEESHRAAEAARKGLAETLAGLKHPDFTALCKERGLEVRRTPDFRRGDYLPGIGVAPAFQKAAFALTPEKPLSDVAATPAGSAILFLEDRSPADPKAFAEAEEGLTRELLQKKKDFIFNDFLTKLRLRAELEDLVTEGLRKKKAPVTGGPTSIPVSRR